MNSPDGRYFAQLLVHEATLTLIVVGMRTTNVAFLIESYPDFVNN